MILFRFLNLPQITTLIILALLDPGAGVGDSTAFRASGKEMLRVNLTRSISFSFCQILHSFELASWLSPQGGGRVVRRCWGWSGGAKVLSKLSVPGRPTCLDDSRARAYCACSRCEWGLFGHFFLSSIFSLFFLPLFGRRLDID